MKAWARYALLALGTMAASAEWSAPTDATPAFYTIAPLHTNARILYGDQLTGPSFTHPFQATIYKMAAKVSPALFQQPCYCRCDRALRHKSLHSCFEGLHGAACGTCMREAMYTYQQTQGGRSPEQIRAGIERGEAQALRLEDAAL